MRLFFLGTAAAEGFPAIFCNCERCNTARALGGRNIRLRSALLVNDDLLLDFGPDLLASAQRFGLNLSQVTTALVTHAHLDHFELKYAELRGPAFTGRLEIPIMNMYGSGDVVTALNDPMYDLEKLRMTVHRVRAFDRWQAGGYTFSAFRAYHAIDTLEALFYAVEDDRHAVLYATDTGPLTEDTWQALEGRTFDVIILEETLGDGGYNQHLGFETFLAQVARMRAMGLLRPGGRVLAHHFSHSGNPIHAEIEAILNPHGVEVAYDGLEIRLD